MQLKERKRIEEAGGFVSHNGVWRVQGILAVSRYNLCPTKLDETYENCCFRALGDMPLKTRGLITCEPDVLVRTVQTLSSSSLLLLLLLLVLLLMMTTIMLLVLLLHEL